MGSLATLMATAAVSLGAVALIRTVRQRAGDARRRMERARARAEAERDGPVIDLEQGDAPDEWRVPKDTTGADAPPTRG